MTDNLEKWTIFYGNITSRLNELDNDTILKHHVNQFKIFCENAEKCLRESQNDSETDGFVLLSSQWERLDNVVSQYLQSSPYFSDLKKLEGFNKQACGYYQQLCRALTEEITTPLSLSAPLYYFGDPSTGISELLLFRRGAPALIGIPDSKRGEPVIAYETARAFFEQLPDVLPELKSRVQNHLPGLHKTIFDGLADIVAKLTGIALLFDRRKIKKGLLTPALPDIAETETKHPVVLLLPYIGLETLQRFLKHFPEDDDLGDQKNDDVIEQIKKDLDTLLGDQLTRQCEFIPGSTTASLQEIKATMPKVVGILLSGEMTLDALEGRSLLEVLAACAEDTSENTETLLSDWGILSDKACQQFVTELPDLLCPICASPLPFSARPVLFMSPKIPSFTWIDILKSIFE